MNKIKYFICIIIACIIFYPNEVTYASYPDVPKNSWYYENIINLNERNLIKGYENGNFGPNDPIIRQNVARILGRWLIEENYYIPEDALSNKRFFDIPLSSDQELLNVTSMLYEEGIFVGYQGVLSGKDNITREHMAQVLVRTINTIFQIDLIKEAQEANYKSPVTDIHNLPLNSQQSINALSYAGLTKNIQYLPKNNLTRAEFVAFLDRTIQFIEALKSAEEEEYNNSEEISIENQTHMLLQKGTPLFSSSNLTRQIATLQQDQQFMLKISNAKNAAYIEIGKEYYYVSLNDVQLVSNPVEANLPKANELGYVRLQAPFIIYADSTLKIPFIQGNTESRFSVKQIQNNVAAIDLDGKTYYIDFSKHTIYPTLPQTLLKSEPVIKGDKNVGTLDLNTSLFVSSVNSTKATLKDKYATYTITKQALIEKDEYKVQKISEPYKIAVTIKSDQAVLGLDGQKVGTIKAGKIIFIHNTNGANGYTYFASMPVQLPLTAIYHTNLVDGANIITYEMMVEKLKQISTLYPSFTKLEVIGQSVEGRAIYALKVGTGNREILLDASMHAREHMTTNVLMEMIDEYTHMYSRNGSIDSYAVKSVLDKTSIWFVPMINVDGVSLVQKGVDSTSYKDSIIKMNGSSNVGRWKANIRGVDLNRNFDNNWIKASSAAAPSWKNYKGTAAFSEPESRALRDFIAKHSFQAYISYHSSGNILYYWNWQNATDLERDFNFAKKISTKTGYSMMNPNYGTASGNSMDWFIKVYKKPAITMEISPYVVDQPVPLKNWSDVWNRNKSIGLLSAKETEGF